MPGKVETVLFGNFNLALTGSMFGGLVLVVFLMCYCCHRNMKKSACSFSDYCQEEIGLQEESSPHEVFTVHSQVRSGSPPFLYPSMCQPHPSDPLTFVIPCSPMPSPPPAYDSVVGSKSNSSFDPQGLPSYEAALLMQSHGFL